MKYALLILCMLGMYTTHAQSKKELRAQIEVLTADTSTLIAENQTLKKELYEALRALNASNNDLYRSKSDISSCNRRNEELNKEIEELSSLLERTLDVNIKKEDSRKFVYFGERDEFHGYDLDKGIGFGPDWYIAVPFGLDRELTNTIDLSKFSIKYATQVYYKVQINKGGYITSLWCNENKSSIKNKTLLRLIGEEIQRQAKYTEGEITQFPLDMTRLVELSVFIPGFE